MNQFRESLLSKALTLLTTLVFLNMSFFLAEVKLLKLEKDSRFTKIIALVVAGTCFEEEKEAGGETAEEETTAKKIDVLFGYQNHSNNQYVLLSDLLELMSHQPHPSGGDQEIFTPPPES
jgi:hypothetical protein